MSLANTNWNLNDGSGTPAVIAFGPNKSTGANPGGQGTLTYNYPNVGPVVTPIIWMEDGKGRFMYQTQGPTDAGSSQLPTVNGVYTGTAAIGWGANFESTTWGTWDVSMTAV